MKFEINTASKPVVGKEAKKLAKAIKLGGHVATTNAMVTMERIAQRHNKSLVINDNK